MDSDRFDALAQSLVPARSRRGALRLAAGALVAFGAADAGVAEANKRHHKKKCKHGEKKCKTKCCQKGEICAKGTCVTGQGTCKAGDDSCLGIGDPFCFAADGSECICNTRLDGGTRCGVFGNKSACDQCSHDANCLALGFPPGSSCVLDFGGTCQACGDNALGICILPCGVKDPT